MSALLAAISSSSSFSKVIFTRQLVTATAILTTTVVVWVFRNRRSRSQSSPRLPYPPGPPGVPYFGNALEIPDPAVTGILPEAKGLEWARDYGKVFTLHFPYSGRLIVVLDPALVKQLLVRKNVPKDHTLQEYRPIVGKYSMLLSNGPIWSKYRRIFNPGFSPPFLKTMIIPIMASKLTRFLQGIDNDIERQQETPTLKRASLFTSDVIAGVVFGEDWGGDYVHETRQWEQDIARLLEGMELDWTRWLGTDLWRQWRVWCLQRKMDQRMMDIVERRLVEKEKMNSTKEEKAPTYPGPKHKDICSLALEVFGDGPLSREEKIAICHQLKTFYFGGHDTTASTISWTLWNLSQHPRVLIKLRSELDALRMWVSEVHPHYDENAPPSYDELQKCSYLEAVIHETLRLYPPSASVTRLEVDENFTWNDYTIGGGIVGVNIYAIHRHPDLWNEPDSFRPERFLDGSESDLADKFIPFSRGPRGCIGKYFALTETKLAVSAICQLYDWDCVDPAETLAGVVLCHPSKGAKLVFRKRQL